MPRNRYHNALFIHEGACNPSGITHALLSAIHELHAENADTPTICNDPAVRLIAHQLAWILNLREFDRDLDAYGCALDTCREKSQ